jgi:hypothetical protein
VTPVKILLSDLFQRLKLKKKKFGVRVAASDSDIEEMWKNVTTIDSSVHHKLPTRKICPLNPGLSTIAVVRGTTFLKFESVEKVLA